MGITNKPDLREQIGVAVNASTLELHVERDETALLRVAALGGAALRIQTGADFQRLPVAAMDPEVIRRSADMRELMLHPPGAHIERNTLEAELVPVLWHIRYGGQHGLIPIGVALFAQWIVGRRVFSELAAPEHQIIRQAFAVRCVHEWLSDRCSVCGGSGKQEKSSTGRWLKPRGAMQRNAVFRPCVACNGTRRAAIRHPERMKLLGLTREQYDEQRWPQRFTAAMLWLSELLPQRLVRALTAELERRKTRA